MPEHNAAESRSHFSAWAIVSAPLVLGFDLSDDSKIAAAWPIVSNKEAIAISQTWVHGTPYPTGRLIKSWQAPNLPTLVVRGGCGTDACADSNPRCAEWAKEDQCIANPGYMRQNCKKSCHACDQGDYAKWKCGAALEARAFPQSTLPATPAMPALQTLPNLHRHPRHPTHPAHPSPPRPPPPSPPPLACSASPLRAASGAPVHCVPATFALTWRGSSLEGTAAPM